PLGHGSGGRRRPRLRPLRSWVDAAGQPVVPRAAPALPRPLRCLARWGAPRWPPKPPMLRAPRRSRGARRCGARRPAAARCCRRSRPRTPSASRSGTGGSSAPSTGRAAWPCATADAPRSGAGWPVHIVTVNDYLAKRDAEWMGPIYRALGLRVGLVVHGLAPDERRTAYACDITYVTNKEIAFDYLRDRITLRGHPSRLQLQL